MTYIFSFNFVKYFEEKCNKLIYKPIYVEFYEVLIFDDRVTLSHQTIYHDNSVYPKLS